ncbi:PTS system mannose-specific EIIBCA component [Poriferisphaera corsica]|uniref:PTS system mannose-specific EIIBCA component n=1 Tax=Poriferisphaera corsica TaxID=2528020 RepID=A0A517YTS7_9BACT|nr:PTS sugar transporter subunit IIA [Poriferisphaera corsica]QDU33635.1 PTS system mannose-specific EIIBCA component [Poriferisphaera corsica]
MRLTDILQPESVVVPLDAEDKQEAIFKLADALVSSNGIQDANSLQKAIWERETTRTTGIGHGIAIPHGKSEGVASLCMAIGLPSTPVDFNSIDGRPVDLIILLASPVDQTGPHIQALAKISRMLMNEDFRSTIKDAKTGEDLFKLIAEYEADAPV